MAHAAVQTLATRHAVDLVHIKGVALDPRLAFPGRSSADADVLCRPEHVERLLLAMRESGWSLLNTFTKSSAFEHSATLHHPTWGWLDLHRRYPGLGRDPATAFDTLWATRGVATIAGVPCAVPAPSDQAVLLLLHAARSPGELKARSDVAHVWGSATPESRDAILSSVDRLGADLAFAVILGSARGAPGRPRVRPVEDRLGGRHAPRRVACTGACGPRSAGEDAGGRTVDPRQRRAPGAHRSPHGSQGPRRGVLRPSHPWCQGAVRRRALASSGQETG